jgi:hypothetical protein
VGFSLNQFWTWLGVRMDTLASLGGIPAWVLDILPGVRGPTPSGTHSNANKHEY